MYEHLYCLALCDDYILLVFTMNFFFAQNDILFCPLLHSSFTKVELLGCCIPFGIDKILTAYNWNVYFPFCLNTALVLLCLVQNHTRIKEPTRQPSVELVHFILGWHMMYVKGIFSKWRSLSHPKPFAEGTFYKYHGWCSQVAWELGKASLSMESDWFSDALINQVAYVHVCICMPISCHKDYYMTVDKSSKWDRKQHFSIFW